MNDIYNICLLDSNGNPDKIYIFSNNEPTDNLKNKLFSESQLLEFENYNTEFIYCSQYIYNDDNIKNIKRKFLSEVNDDDDIYYEEIYLFANSSVNYNIDNIFKNISKNGFDINRSQFIQFNKNINNDITTTNNIFTIDDLYDLNLPSRLDLNIPLGKTFSSDTNFLFSANPFNIMNTSDPVFDNTNSNNLITFDNTLLNNYNMSNNTIYATCASDILSFANQNNFSSEYFVDIYFNSLKKYDINNLTQLTNNKNNLAVNNDKNVNSNTKKYNDQINLYHSIYYNNNKTIDYLENGINNVNFIMFMNNYNSLPLDALFKILHASKNTPFIKFNPGKKKENIFRIFSTEKSKNGKNIPFISQNDVNKLSRTIGRGDRQIAFYNLINIENNEYVVIIELLEKSIFNIKINSNSFFDVNIIDNIVSSILNPIIKNINSFIEQYGYNLEYYKNYRDHNIKVINIDYFKSIQLVKSFQFKKYKNFINNLFVTIDDSKPNSFINLTYKRVSNYKQTDAIKKKIYNMFNGSNISEMISNLMDEFDLTEDEAIQNIRDFETTFNMIDGRPANNIDKIIENPGFKSTITFIPGSDEVHFMISDIDSFDYIKNLNIYLDSIFRISQYYDTIKLPKKSLDNINKKVDTDNIEDQVLVDIPTIIKPVEFKKINIEDDPIFNVNRFEEKGVNLDEFEQENEKEDDDEDEDSEGGIFFDDDDIDDDDDDDDMVGGSKTKNETNVGVNLDGMALEKPNLFFKKLISKEPELFLTKKDGKFNAYSRLCQHNSGKQPVILTDDEKNYIDENHPNSYTHSFRYGTKDTKYNYICPKYWCLKTNSSISEEEVKKGNCGKVIPSNAKTVPPGHYVLQSHNNNKDFSPGFLSKDKHPDGKCVPCCFKADKWDTKPKIDGNGNIDSKQPPKNLQQKRREECIDGIVAKDDKNSKQKANYDKYDYIISSESFVHQSRYGFLPTEFELYLNEDYSKKINPDNIHQLQVDKVVLLRYGVEPHKTQSFISCLSQINYSIFENTNKSITLDSVVNFKEKIISRLDIDVFISMQNGSLINIFKPKTRTDIDLNLYQNDKAYKKIDPKNEDQILFFKDIVLSYNNFINFLKDDEVTIDHTYLWDLVSSKDSGLFDQGLNLIILQKTNNDLTGNIELLCPTNAYSGMLFDNNKPACIMIKTDNIYELVIVFSIDSEDKTNTSFKTIFEFNDRQVEQYKDTIFEIISNIINHKCKPISNAKTNVFSQNIDPYVTYETLLNNGFVINAQVINFQGKTISLLVNRNFEKDIVIPITPSKMFKNIDIKFMDDDNIYSDYIYTVDMLRQIKSDTNNKVLCNPQLKIIEDGLIVGILTETNQFIQIVPPAENIHNDNIKEINRSNYVSVEKSILKSKPNEKRFDVYNHIKLETHFYNAFRNTVKILLNNRANKNEKRKLIERIKDDKIIYKQKVKDIETFIRYFAKGHVEFVQFEEETLREIDSISTCFSEERKKKLYCTFKKDNNVLLIPDKHLISDYENDKIYYYRVADELIRYKDMQQFILNPKIIVTANNIEYNINNNEFIIIESLLDSDYFDNIDKITNDYAQNITHDISIPETFDDEIKSSNIVKSDDNIKDIKYLNSLVSIDCTKNTYIINDEFIKTDDDLWRKKFINTKEHFFRNTIQCTFNPLQLILYKRTGSKWSLYQIKSRIFNVYENYKQHFDKIVHILKTQGKRKLMKNVINIKSLEKVILSDEYYLTELDIFAFCNMNNLNVVLFSNSNFNTMNSNINWLLIDNKNNEDQIKASKYYFIRTPNYISDDVAPSFSLINTSKLLSDIGLNDFDNYKTKNINSFEPFIIKYKIK